MHHQVKEMFNGFNHDLWTIKKWPHQKASASCPVVGCGCLRIHSAVWKVIFHASHGNSALPQFPGHGYFIPSDRWSCSAIEASVLCWWWVSLDCWTKFQMLGEVNRSLLTFIGSKTQTILAIPGPEAPQLSPACAPPHFLENDKVALQTITTQSYFG